MLTDHPPHRWAAILAAAARSGGYACRLLPRAGPLGDCACAQPDHPGHGLRFLWTRSAKGRKTVGRQLAAAEVEKVRRELARHAEFAAISEQVAEVNEQIARPGPWQERTCPRCRGRKEALTVRGMTHTWTSSVGGTGGPAIAAYTTVQVSCKTPGFAVQDEDSWWYRISSKPWDSSFYAPADAFYNNGHTSGHAIGTPFVDGSVSDCHYPTHGFVP